MCVSVCSAASSVTVGLLTSETETNVLVTRRSSENLPEESSKLDSDKLTSARLPKGRRPPRSAPDLSVARFVWSGRSLGRGTEQVDWFWTISRRFTAGWLQAACLDAAARLQSCSASALMAAAEICSDRSGAEP